jgi:nitrite reductase/ring-hydroxylating ferredoxin subunit
MTMLRVRACAAAEVGEDEGHQVKLLGRPPIALFRIGEEIFATDDTCTHGAASLCEGLIENGEVECPFHAGKFDIRTGAATLHPCTVALQTYAVSIEQGMVVIDLPAPVSVSPGSTLP